MLRYLKLFENFKPFQLPEFWYHGTNTDFNKFDLKYLGSNFNTSILGVYFTQYLQPPPYSASALEFAKKAVEKSGGHPIIYKCKVNLDNPLIVDSKGYYNSNEIADLHRQKLKHQMQSGNHDGIIVYNSDSNDDFLLITPNIDKIQIIEKLRPR
jgi:hypothetical protein